MKQGGYRRQSSGLLLGALALAACAGQPPAPLPPVSPPSPPPPMPPPVPGAAQDGVLPDGSMPDIVDTRQFAAPFLATRMFVRPGFRAPDGMGAVAVIIFPRTAAAQPNRMRDACLAFVGVLGDSRQVMRSNPDAVQMVTL